jgi:hypothetical protein
MISKRVAGTKGAKRLPLKKAAVDEETNKRPDGLGMRVEARE